MSELRDARLQRALENAPDEAGAPSHAVADAIHRRARQALQEDGALSRGEQRHQPWWKALWLASGSPSAPWNAAFATLVLAGFVTLLWQGSEIPGADPQAFPSAAPAPAPAPAVATAPAATADSARPAAPGAVPPAAPARPSAEKERAGTAAEGAQERRSAQRNDRMEAPREAVAKQSAAPGGGSGPNAFPAAPAAAPELSRPAAPPPAPVSPATTSGALAGAAEADMRNRQEAMSAPARESRQRDAAAQAPAPALQRPLPAARAAGPAWESARVTRDGRAADLGPEAAQRLGVAVRALIETASPGAAPIAGAPASLRIELRSGNDVETLELAGDVVRWTRRGSGTESAGTGVADPARLDALLAEVARLMPR